MRFSAALGRGLREDLCAGAEWIVARFQGPQTRGFRYHAALLLTDVLARIADDLVARLARLTGSIYRLFGGGGGDDARFQHTVVFCGTEVLTDAVVALAILSNKPIGVGVRPGFALRGERMRVRSLNGVPPVEVFGAHAAATGQSFDRQEPAAFFLHNVLGIAPAEGQFSGFHNCTALICSIPR